MKNTYINGKKKLPTRLFHLNKWKKNVLSARKYLKKVIITLKYLILWFFLFSGNYSVTGFEMIMKRRVSHYMITYYLPSSLFVVVSWTSFLIPRCHSYITSAHFWNPSPLSWVINGWCHRKVLSTAVCLHFHHLRGSFSSRNRRP